MGNGEAKELICMTHGHELRWGNNGGRVGTGQRGIKGRKKWDNCNSIINKIYLKNKGGEEKQRPQKPFLLLSIVHSWLTYSPEYTWKLQSTTRSRYTIQFVLFYSCTI